MSKNIGPFALARCKTIKKSYTQIHKRLYDCDRSQIMSRIRTVSQLAHATMYVKKLERATGLFDANGYSMHRGAHRSLGYSEMQAESHVLSKALYISYIRSSLDLFFRSSCSPRTFAPSIRISTGKPCSKTEVCEANRERVQR